MPWKILQALGDAGRGFAALFLWNTRKSLYRINGGRCPCHNQSDHPVAGRVRCEAAADWRDPGRFRLVCPLLVRTGEGWRCSVGPEGVRPFWGRAFGLLAAAGFAAYLALTLTMFVGLRLASDAPVGWVQVAWPGQWREIPRIQSADLFDRAMRAFREGRMAEAHLALESARRRNPDNYEAGLLLAQIAMYQRSFLFADSLFTELQAGHPGQRLRTAVSYHDTLLGMDRLDTLALYSLDMAALDPQRAAVWVRSALLAVHSLPPAKAAAMSGLFAKQGERLAAHARLLLQAELDLQDGRREDALRRLREPFSGPCNPFYTGYQIERLAGLGEPGRAQDLLDRLGPALGEFEHLRLQAVVARAAGDEWGAQAAFTALLRRSLTAAQGERLAALLITQPDAASWRAFGGRVRGDPALLRSLGAPTMWVTALTCREPAEARAWQALLEGAGAGELTTIDFSHRDVLRPGTALHLINTLSLPREVILALLWRSERQASATPAAGR